MRAIPEIDQSIQIFALTLIGDSASERWDWCPILVLPSKLKAFMCFGEGGVRLFILYVQVIFVCICYTINIVQLK